MNFFLRCFTAMWLVLSGLSISANAAELLVIEQDFCPYCERFNNEIAEAYPKTEEGKRAPLKRIDLHDTWPAEYKDIRREMFTPVFILVENGKEIDRLTGYPGDEYFWFLLDEMLQKLPAP